MYSIKPWGHAAIVGNTVAGVTLGIGMRWRETVAHVYDRRPDPGYELGLLRRCLLSRNTVRLLVDLGVTEPILMRELRPVTGWRFYTPDLHPLREGATFPGCAPSEDVFQVPEGCLLRCLRREYQHFGGDVSWDTIAYLPQPSSDGTGYWQLTKDYGAQQSLEAIISTCKKENHPEASDVLFHRDDAAAVPTVPFGVTTGVCTKPAESIAKIFKSGGKGNAASAADYAVVLGRDFAVHLWRPANDQLLFPSGTVAWRRTAFADADIARGISELHPDVRMMMASGEHTVDVKDDVVHVATSACPLMEEAHASRVTLLGNGLLATDPFEFRGDKIMTDIEDATALCRRLYTQRFHRGFVPTDFREYEMDTLTKRLHHVQRDLQDADMFLNALEELPEDAQEAAQRVAAPGGPEAATDGQEAQPAAAP